MSNKRRILIIEDNFDFQEILKINFESEGVEVLQSYDGIDGLIDMIALDPDIVLLDLMMPRMDGFELLQLLSERKGINVPIVICSNVEEHTYIKKSSCQKIDLFIEKPHYNGGDITKKVLSFLDTIKA